MNYPIEAEIHDLVRRYMMWDNDQLIPWLGTRNPLLGGSSPNQLIRTGREEKLLKFIKACIKENSASSENNP